MLQIGGGKVLRILYYGIGNVDPEGNKERRPNDVIKRLKIIQ